MVWLSPGPGCCCQPDSLLLQSQDSVGFVSQQCHFSLDMLGGLTNVLGTLHSEWALLATVWGRGFVLPLPIKGRLEEEVSSCALSWFSRVVKNGRKKSFLPN